MTDIGGTLTLAQWIAFRRRMQVIGTQVLWRRVRPQLIGFFGREEGTR